MKSIVLPPLSLLYGAVTRTRLSLYRRGTFQTTKLERPVISLIGYMNPKRVGPYRRYRDLLIDAYGDPGEDYAISMDKRPGRMERITVNDVMEKVQLWRDRYGVPKR